MTNADAFVAEKNKKDAEWLPSSAIEMMSKMLLKPY